MVALDAEERSQGRGSSVVVRLASGIEPEWLIGLYPEQVVEEKAVAWDTATERVVARDRMTWRGLTLHEAEGVEPPAREASKVLAEAAQAAGARTFCPEGALDRWLARARFAASNDAAIRAPDDHAVRAALLQACEGLRSFAELRSAGVLHALRASVTGGNRIDLLAPERVTLAGGRSVPVEYEPSKPPRIASRLQDFFGMSEGPRVGGGKVPLVLELLAPNGRAVQVTSDLAGFWQRHYPAVRKELMRRYPKHSWPEDPTKPAPRMRPRT
jgi:ATP-dependent helicase HrpB